MRPFHGLRSISAACADREYRYGDPLFVDVGLEELLSDAHVRARVGAIDMQRAMPDMPPPVGRYPANAPPPSTARICEKVLRPEFISY